MNYQNTFFSLPSEEQDNLKLKRKELNDTIMDSSLEEIKNRFLVVYHAEDGIRLRDDHLKRNIGYIGFSTIKDNVIILNTYSIEPVYQNYGFSTLLLGLFRTNIIPKIEKNTSIKITAFRFGTELLKPQLTQASSKCFEYCDGLWSNPHMEDIRSNVYEKLKIPHLHFNSGTAVIHIGKYSNL